MCAWCYSLDASVCYTDSGHLLLPPLAKLLCQLTEAATKSELTGIPSGTGSLTHPSLLLKSILSQLLRVSETMPERLSKCLGHVRVCVGGVVCEAVRVGALSSVAEDRLSVMEVIVETVVKAQVDYIKMVSMHVFCKYTIFSSSYQEWILHSW